jgi:L-ascorbate metabolism protein UlaG (beta-lactamase superfamily)
VTARFEDRATRPARGPRDMLKWKLGAKPPRDAALDAVRPLVREGAAAALAAATEPLAAWIGHASWAVRIGGKLVLIDPILSPSISGVVRRLVPPAVAIADLPPIDAVLVTHDHRDHMDLPSLAALGDAPTYVVPLGNGPRIAKLGARRSVVELDWWQTHELGDVQITLVPARHWSMRMPWNRNDTLWGGYVVRDGSSSIYHSGDTAWGDHFAEIGARCGTIDLAMLPIGGYAPRWFMEPQHVDPEEAGRAFEALGARVMAAMHWGTFRLTDEAIGEPPARLRAWWQERGLPAERLWIPDIGETRGIVL